MTGAQPAQQRACGTARVAPADRAPHGRAWGGCGKVALARTLFLRDRGHRVCARGSLAFGEERPWAWPWEGSGRLVRGQRR